MKRGGRLGLPGTYHFRLIIMDLLKLCYSIFVGTTYQIGS